jgi:hypothetical protein
LPSRSSNDIHFSSRVAAPGRQTPENHPARSNPADAVDIPIRGKYYKSRFEGEFLPNGKDPYFNGIFASIGLCGLWNLPSAQRFFGYDFTLQGRAPPVPVGRSSNQ